MKKIIWIISLFFLFGSHLSAQFVHPGDVDNNGEVNHLDLLYIGIANGVTGPPRALQSPIFQPNTFTPWGITFPNTGLDYAYADCNGDGIVNFDDRHVVEFNYGLTHGSPTPVSFTEGVPGVNPQIYFDSLGFFNPFPQLGIVSVNLSLGLPSLPATDFYGVSFTIEYDPNIFCDFNCMFAFQPNLDPNFDPTGFSFFEIAKPKNDDPASGKLEVTIVKNNQSPVDGFGNIGNYAGIIEDNVIDLYGSGGQLNTLIRITDIKLIDEGFTESPVVADSLTVQIIDPDSLLSSVEDLDLGINIFPNPVEDIFTIESLLNPILEVQIADLNGQTVYLNTPHLNNASTEKIELSLSDYPEGIYFVKLLTEKGNIVKKITVLRE